MSITLIFSTSILLFYVDVILNERQLLRLERLSALEEETRYDLYARAVSLILEQPLIGYGSGGTATYFNGTYPHNIFLDVLFNGGLLLFIPFICIIFLCIKSIFFAISRLGRDPNIIDYSNFYVFILTVEYFIRVRCYIYPYFSLGYVFLLHREKENLNEYICCHTYKE
jgi:O-antigen ligase